MKRMSGKVLYLLPSREKARMRVIKTRVLALANLTPTLSLTRGTEGFCDIFSRRDGSG